MENPTNSNTNRDPMTELRSHFDERFGPEITGDPQQDVMINLQRILFRLVTIEEVGSPFFRTEGGGLGINVKGTSLEPLYHAIARN